MTQSCCGGSHPLDREGTTQSARVLSALAPARAPLDGRRLEQLLAYLVRYAETVKYYDLDNTEQGNWRAFLEGDPAAVLANVSDFRSMARIGRLEGSVRALSLPLVDAAAIDERKTALAQLYDGAFDLVRHLDEWSRIQLDPKLALPELLRTRLPSLKPGLALLVGSYLATTNLRAPSPGGPAQQVMASGVDLARWTLDVPSWSAFKQRPPVDPVMVTPPADLEEWQKITFAAEAVHIGLARLAPVFAAAEGSVPMDLALTLRDSSHPPHMALLLSFLQLFERAQRGLDGLTARHLDYYYQQVLQLRCRPAEADSAHLVFSLARQVDSLLLPKGTLFSAGKDPDQRPLQYALADDMRVHRAQVARILAVYRDAGGVLRASSSDDADAAPTPAGTAPALDWRTLQDKARVGFAVASPVLRLAAGTRVITMEINVDGWPNSISQARFRLQLTGPEDWIDATPGEPSTFRGGRLTIKTTLDAKAPPVVPYQSEIHKGSFNSPHPLCRVLLEQDGGKGFEAFDGCSITDMTLTVTVTGSQAFEVLTGSGPVSPARPFAPFGPQPVNGASFDVRWDELGGKDLKSADATLSWTNLPEGGLSAYFAGYPGDTKSYAVTAVVPGSTSTEADQAIEAAKPILLNLGGQRLDDTIRIKLSCPSRGFGHRDFPQLMTAAAVQKATSGVEPTWPKPPFTPMLSSIALSYTAEDRLFVTEEPHSGFFHLHPFGESAVDWRGGSLSLFPRHPDQVEQYIGFTGATPGERVSVLFSVEDGSAAPALEEPAVAFSYLQEGGRYALFSRPNLTDGTLSLAQSGIVQLIFPKDASTLRGPLPAGYLWLRISVASDGEATNRLRALRTQAAMASLVAPNDHPRHAFGLLPEKSIAKAASHIAALNSVEQVGSSFGGRPPESESDYRLRVSERLRHKQRAVTARDYEALVLQSFPQLYSVKCLPHTKIDLNRSPADSDCTLVPGHVSVVPVARVADVTSPARSLPYVTQSTLRAIETLLKPWVGPGVVLQAVQPRFESLRITASVKFIGSSDPAIGRELLLAELHALFSPWVHATAPENPSRAFESSVHRSSVVHFIETRSYVDYVDALTVDLFGSDGAVLAADAESIRPSTARSVLVSGKHDLRGLAPGGAR